MSVRLALPIALSGVALLGASSAQGVPAAGPGYVASFQISYDSPPFPDTRYHMTVSITGDVCSDPFENTGSSRERGQEARPHPRRPSARDVRDRESHQRDRRSLDRCERARDRPDRVHPAFQRWGDAHADTFVGDDGRHRERRRDAAAGDADRAAVAQCPGAAASAPLGQRCLGHGRRAPCSSTAGGTPRVAPFRTAPG